MLMTKLLKIENKENREPSPLEPFIGMNVTIFNTDLRLEDRVRLQVQDPALYYSHSFFTLSATEGIVNDGETLKIYTRNRIYSFGLVVQE